MDQKIFLLLSGLSGQYVWFDKLIYFCAALLPWVTVFIFAVWILTQKSWSEKVKGVVIFFSAGLVWWLASLFKYTYFSPRPFMELFQNKPLFMTEVWWDSLPSGHTVFFASLASASILLKNKYLTTVLWVVTITIGLSRIISGVHWPSDVLAGLILGGFLGFGLAKFFSRVFHIN